mgnify:CR=1 FL=1
MSTENILEDEILLEEPMGSFESYGSTESKKDISKISNYFKRIKGFTWESVKNLIWEQKIIIIIVILLQISLIVVGLSIDS